MPTVLLVLFSTVTMNWTFWREQNVVLSLQCSEISIIELLLT